MKLLTGSLRPSAICRACHQRKTERPLNLYTGASYYICDRQIEKLLYNSRLLRLEQENCDRSHLVCMCVRVRVCVIVYICVSVCKREGADKMVKGLLKKEEEDDKPIACDVCVACADMWNID